MESVRIIRESRVIVLNGEINDDVAEQVCVALLELEAENPSKEITLMLNSGGGSVIAGWQIIDTIRLIGNVETVCVGMCASMAAVILASGRKGKRSALMHSKMMIHQPIIGAPMMQSADFQIVADELSRSKKELYDFISDCTGKPFAQIEADCDRDHWLTAQEALDYGLIDYIVSKENR